MLHCGGWRRKRQIESVYELIQFVNAHCVQHFNALMSGKRGSGRTLPL
jgi:hypothetical protein